MNARGQGQLRVSRLAILTLVAALAVPGVLFSAAGASAPAGSRDEDEPEAVATLEIQHDEVEVKLDGEDDFEPADDGQDLHEGDTVRTDEDGRATIEYEDDSFTRLDVDTTFKIVSLTDDEGNRKVEGSLDAGKAWNRTESLTESESFEMSGAGATAAVVGTAFAQECESVDECVWTAVEHDILITAQDGTPQLIPLDQVKVIRGLLGQVVHLTLAQIASMGWIQQNLYLDKLIGFGQGPFVVPTGTTTTTTTTGTTTGTTPPPPGAQTVPGAPSNVSVVVGDGQAIVSFTEPPDGGSPITSYTAFGTLVSETTFSTTAIGDVSASGPGSPIVVNGLQNGQSYVFQVTATNAVGTSAASATSDAVRPAGVPGAPEIAGVHVPGGSGTAHVTFTEPPSNGSLITSYTVTPSPSGTPVTGPGELQENGDLTIAVPGLVNGTTYTFTVRATNGVGAGPASAPSDPVTPAGVPDAPTQVSAVGGDEQATVSFTAPSANGSTITSYTVTSDPEGVTATGTSSPIVVDELTNGTAYQFTVTATNGVGTGPASAVSNSVIPAAVPDAPVIQSVLPQNNAVKVTFSVPNANGSLITTYTVTPSSGTPVSGLGTASGANRYLEVPVANGAVYTFTVTATNAIGTSPASATSGQVWPGPPAPPINVTATALDQDSVSVSFSPDNKPQQNGTFQYRVTASNGAYVEGASSPLVLNELPLGTYTFTVQAKNLFGFSSASAASNPVTMPTAPGAPTNVVATAGNGVIDVNFDAPASDGGSPITTYTVTANPTGTTASTNSTNIQVYVPNGTEYTVTVTATNAIGTSPASAPSNAVTPAGHASQPQNVSAVALNGAAKVLFSGPSSNGGSPVHTFTATSSPGVFTTTGSSSPLVVTGLTNGVTYTFTVTATNGAGTGSPSDPSNQVTPGPPAPPTNVTANSYYYGTEVSWTHADLPGQKPTFKYKVTSSSGEVEYTSGTSVSFGCLDEGTSTFTVQAKNVFGYSAASAPSNEVEGGCSEFSSLSIFSFLSSGPPEALTSDNDAPPPTTEPPSEEPPAEEPPPTTEPPSEEPPAEEPPPTTEPPSEEPPAEEPPPTTEPPSEETTPPATEPTGEPVLF